MLRKDVFISYSQEDESIARLVCAVMEQRKIDCWIACRDIPAGETWPKAIVKAIRDCRVMILIFSCNSNTSEHVLREIMIAVAKGRPIIPLRFEGTETSEDLEYFLIERQWWDALTDPREPHIERLIPIVREIIEQADGARIAGESHKLNSTHATDSESSLKPGSDSKSSASRPARLEARMASNKERSLFDLLHESRMITVVTGERRARPVQFPSDILLSVAWGDFALLDKLPHPANHDVVPDPLFAEDWIRGRRDRDVFCRTLLCVGAPDVNFAALCLNGLALFRFIVDKDAEVDLIDAFQGLRNVPHHELSKILAERREEHREIVHRLCPIAVMDPFKQGFVRQGLARRQHGFVSLAGHPYGIDEPCILAAGVDGPTTAGGLSLLAGRRIYDPVSGELADLSTRPLGGVFCRRQPSRPRPHDLLHIDEDLEWVTPPYNRPQLLARLRAMNDDNEVLSTVTPDDINRMLQLAESLDGVSSIPKREGIRAIVFVGGKGRRMEAFTKGTINKTALTIPTGGQSKSTSTVLDILVETLAGTGLVNDIVLLSSNPFVEKHKQIAGQLADRCGISIRAESDGSDGRACLPILLGGYLASRHAAPTVCLMGDTLFSPDDLLEWLRTARDEKQLVGLACAEVSGQEASRYGLVDVDQFGHVCRIWEKPGNTTLRLASQGAYLFSQYIQWKRLVADVNAENLVVLLNALIGFGVPVRPFRMKQRVYDCGSPEGYTAARAQADSSGELWPEKQGN